MRFVQNMLLLASLMLITACASLFSGVEQKVTFNSEPEGATVYVDGLEKGKTPLIVKLRKDEYKNVTFKKSGYRDEEITLHSKFDPLGLLNLLMSTGFTTDALTGAMFEYAPGKYGVKLEKAGAKISGSNMRRNYARELEMLVSENYFKLKSRCQSDCDDVHFRTLYWLVSKVYAQQNQKAKQYVQQALVASDDPVGYLKRLGSDIQKGSRHIAVRKGNQ